MSQPAKIPQPYASRPCPLCGTFTLAEPLHVQHFAGAPSQDIRQCHECGMIYADSGLSQRWYDTYYRTRSKYHDYGGETVPDDARRHAHTATHLAPFASHSARLLDFGCANGALLRHLHEEGWTSLHGYDPSATSTEKAASASIHVVGDLAPASFDVIVMSHVLEHIYDVDPALRRLVGALTSGGILYVEVPDASAYRAISPYQEFNVEHVNHFTLATLCALLCRYGLVPLHVGTKTLRVGDGIDQQAIFGVFRRQSSADLSAYLAASESRMRAIESHLATLLDPSERVTIWGAGQLTLKLLRLPALRSRTVAIVDANPAIQGTEIDALRVLAPDHVPAGSTIVVGSILNQRSIVDAIARRQLTNRVVTLPGDLT